MTSLVFIPLLMKDTGMSTEGYSGAMEHQTCSSMGFWNTGVVAHELAHQWYGDMITCADWHHIWLNEGFATYLEAVYLEARDGKAAYDTKIEDEMFFARRAICKLSGFRILPILEKFLTVPIL